MKKAVVVPDSFKGTVSSKRICEITEEKILSFYPDCEVVKIPVADGGEGSVDCFLETEGGEKITVTVSGPYMEKMNAAYALLDNGKTAVIEMAACAGLPLVEGKENPLETTTYGVGEIMIDALERGCRKIIMCLGGSCTNDMGTGAAVAAGVKFFDKSGKEFIPVGGTLKNIAKIDMSQKSALFDGVEIITMCDIDNPLFGENGAAYVFAPQKGADKNQVALLDEGLRHCADILENKVSFLPGSGAAGGMGAGMVAFFNSVLRSGIDTVLDTVDFDKKIKSADVIFTGEGKLDSQSVSGKVVSGVAKRAKHNGIPVIAVVGGYDSDLAEIYDMGVSAVFATNRLPQDFEKIKNQSEENLALTVENILRIIKWQV